MVLIITITICVFIQLLFYQKYVRHIEEDSSQIADNSVGISVIIAARNEAENLSEYLPVILEQDYSNFEIIVVDHDSNDETAVILREFQNQHSHLRVISLSKKEYRGKKNILTQAIEKAKYDYLVFTDADCKVVSRDWLSIYSHYFKTGDIVLGYSPYFKQKGLLNKIIRYETLMTGANYLSLAKMGKPYMGVGRNLGYQKELFEKGNGFASHLEIQSGDDDLFVQEHANRENTIICIRKEHFTYSNGKNSWHAYWHQKRRHLSAGFSYSKEFKLLLSLFPLSVIGYWVILCLFLLNGYSYYIPLGFIYFKFLYQIICLKKISKVLGEKDLYLISPLLELMTVIYNGFVALSLLVSKNIEWK